MIEYIILFLLKIKPYLQLLIFGLCATKLVLFLVNRKRTWKMYNFFYFDSTHLILSHSQSSYNSKKFQNTLTQVIVALGAFQILNFVVSQFVVYSN